MKIILAILSTVISLIIAAAIALALYVEGNHRERALYFDTAVEAEVVESFTYSVRDMRFRPKCTYQYRYSGIVHVGSNVDVSDSGYYPFFIGAPLPIGMSKGDRVTVHINSSTPSASVMFVSLPKWWYVALGLSSMLSIILWRRARSKATQDSTSSKRHNEHPQEMSNG